ncbi:MAG: sporulation transcription factor Spo0A [Clostridia bacterium]|nr:sporulation transcription factor Spo0A [Clostridia bacterium]
MERNTEKIRLILAEDNEELRQAMADYLHNQEGMEIIAQAGTGVEALRAMVEHEADVLLLDMIMPNTDGFGVLKLMQSMPLLKRPKVIAVTALGRDDFVRRAVALGVDYYMIKPVEMSTLVQQIYDAVRGEAEFLLPAEKEETHRVLPGTTLEDKLSNLFLTLGIPAHIKGYQFLREAIRLVLDKPDMIGGITKELYPTIARRFGTTSSKVERAIRHAIEVAWGRGRVDALNQAFGCRVVYQDVKPTNGEFIALIADKLKMDKSA